jgi:hypothetical protein
MDIAIKNLTFEQNVIKDHAVEPLAGHSLIVFERVGESGEAVRFELEPGETLPKTRIPLFRRLGGRSDPNYFAFAINRAPKLSYTFSDPFRMDDHGHEFSLVFVLTYSVANGATIATLRAQDPLRRLRDMISKTIGREFKQKAWRDVCHRFRELEAQILVATLAMLTDFAADYGLRIDALTLDSSLPEVIANEVKQDDSVEVTKAAIQREEEVAQKRLTEGAATQDVKRGIDDRVLDYEHRRQLKILLQQTERGGHEDEIARMMSRREVTQAQGEAIKTILRNLSNGINTPSELNDAAAAVLQILQMLPVLQGSADAPFKTQLGVTIRAQLPGSGGLAETLNSMMIQTEQLSCSTAERNDLRSSILHLIAELLLADAADGDLLRRHSKRIKELAAQIKPAIDQFRYLIEVATYENLRYQLS